MLVSPLDWFLKRAGCSLKSHASLIATFVLHIHHVASQTTSLSQLLAEHATTWATRFLFDRTGLALFDSHLSLSFSLGLTHQTSFLLLNLAGVEIGKDLPDSSDHSLIISRILLHQPIHSMLHDFFVHRRQIASNSGQTRLILVLEGWALGSSIIRGSFMDFGPLLIIRPWHARLPEVILQQCLLATLNNRLAPFAIYKAWFNQLAYVLLRTEQFNPHIYNYYN